MSHGLIDKLRAGRVCVGTTITFTDPAVTEALSTVFDFVWIDMEHQPLSIESVQRHIMATNGSEATPLVRVAWNDPVLIKPVLDCGAAGVIVPFVRTADDMRRAVAACRYPPEGIRGYGPRRPSRYGRRGGPAFCRETNERMIVIAQIEHVDALAELDAILAVPGLTGVVIGANDLAGSLGHPGDPQHPDTLRAIDTILAAALRSGVFIGIGVGDDPQALSGWIAKGMQWLLVGADFTLLLSAADRAAAHIRNEGAGRAPRGDA